MFTKSNNLFRLEKLRTVLLVALICVPFLDFQYNKQCIVNNGNYRWAIATVEERALVPNSAGAVVPAFARVLQFPATSATSRVFQSGDVALKFFSENSINFCLNLLLIAFSEIPFSEFNPRFAPPDIALSALSDTCLNFDKTKEKADK